MAQYVFYTYDIGRTIVILVGLYTGAQNINLETRASRPSGHEIRFLFQTNLACIMLTHNEANRAISDATGDFILF